MPHPGVQAGTVLAGRYRVEDLAADSVGARRWRAVDEVLARSVSVEVLPDDDARAQTLLEAARRSSVVSDGRFVHVLDAFDESGAVVVVREWIPGQPLEAMLADGPLSHRRAAWIIRECAAAMAAAHDLGIAHLCLVPANVALTASGGVKIAGLATDAALRSLTSEDPQDDDVRGLGRLLYACLVARWPGDELAGLPAAPTESGRLLRPRQVRAGVPRPLDALCAGLLKASPPNGAHVPRTAREVSTALASALDALAQPPADSPAVDQPAPALLNPPATPPATTPEVAPAADEPTAAFAAAAAAAAAVNPGAPGHGGALRSAGSEPEATTTVHVPVAPAEPPRRGSSALAGSGRPWVRWSLWLAVVALALGAGLLAYQLGRSGVPPDEPSARPSGSPSSDRPSRAPLARVPIAAVTDFDPSADGGNGEENPEQAPLAVDDDPETAWTTLTYYDDPHLANLKPGVGLVVDLGKPVAVSEVKVALVGTGTDVQLRAAPRAATTVPSSGAEFTTVAKERDAGELAVLRPEEQVTTRYVLVYLTSLPLDVPGSYKGGIANISVRG